MLRGALAAPLYFLPLGLIFDLVGCVPPYLRLLLIYMLWGLALCLHRSRRTWRGVGALIVAMALLAGDRLPALAELCLLLVLHHYLWSLVSSPPSRWIAALHAYALVYAYLFLSPLGYGAQEGLAAAASRLAAWFTGSTVQLGPTYSSLGAFLLFLILSLSSWDGSWLSRARTASFLFVAILSNGFLASVLVHQIDLQPDLIWDFQYREPLGTEVLAGHLGHLGVLAFPAVGFVTHALAFLLLHQQRRDDAKPSPPFAKDGQVRGRLPAAFREALLPVTSVLLALLALAPTACRKPAPSDVLLLERGVVSYSKPDDTRYGRAAGGMFGMLPHYIRLFGCNARVVTDVPDSLEGDELLVLTNLDEPFSDLVHRRIWDFVEAGGELWVLGDHTFIKNGRHHINDLLEPSHIRLRNDSAQFFPQGWFHSYRFRQGTPFAGLEDRAENRPGILVGASLHVKAPARPLILGRFGFSDRGLSAPNETGGYLGDLACQSDERLGDLVLVAGESYGAGKVLVFGDTSSFFNNNMSRSHELLHAALCWSGESGSWFWFRSRGGHLAVVLLLLIALALASASSARSAWWALTAVGLVSFVAHRPGGPLPIDQAYARDRLALLDFAHQPYASRHSGMDSGLHGLSINLMRYGLLPVNLDTWTPELVEAATLIAINAPRRPFSGAERSELNEFMTRGGTVLLGCGYAHFEHCRSLLDPLGVSIRGLPLGRFFDRRAFDRPVSFFSAWPIVLDNPDAEVLCVHDEWPLIVSVPVGRGRLIVIGDSEFLHNRNLEGTETHDPANVQFIRSLLESTLPRPPS